MADKRDLKIKKRKGADTQGEPSPMAWEDSAPKKKVRPKKKRAAKSRPVPEVPAGEDNAGADEAQPGRRKKRRSSGVRLAVRVLAFLAAAAVVVTVWRNWDSLAPRNLVFWINQTFSSDGNGYPVEISGNSVLDMQQVQDYLVLLTDTSLVALNAKGGEVMRRQHNFSDPILMTAGKYMLVAELGGRRFRLETMPETILDVTSDNLSADKKSEILDNKIENPILSANVRADGTVALITESSQSYTSEVLVYTPSGKLTYRQQYATMLATDVALSPDERDVAVAGIEAKDGEIQSLLRVHDLESEETQPRKEYTGEGTMLCRVSYFAGGRLAAIGDTETWIVDAGGSLDERISYEQNQLVGYTVGETMVGLALQKYGSGDGGEVMRLDAGGQISYTAAFTGNFRHIYAQGSDFLLLTSGQLYQGDGTALGGGIDVQQDGRMACILGNRAIVLGLTALSEYSLS